LRTYLLASLLLLRVAAAFAGVDEFASRLRAGTEEAQQGQYAAAMADLQAAVILEPDNSQGWYQLGLLLGQTGDFRGAELAFRHSLQLKPDFSPAHYNLALTLIANPQSKLDWPAAIAECREALRYQPDYAEARNLLGAGLTSEGEIDAAIIELQHAVHLNPALPEAHFNLAIALAKNDRLEEAAQEYQAAAAAKGGYPEATTSLGKLYFRLGKMQDAEKELEKAVRLNPDLADAHHALAGVLQSQDKREEAAVEVNVATDLSRRTIDAIESARLSNVGLQLASKGDFAGADATLRQAIALKPDYGIPHYNLGLILADQKNFSAALQELIKAISLLPGQAKPWLQTGRVLLAQGDSSRALDALAWAARLSPSDAATSAQITSLQSSGSLPPAVKKSSGLSAAPALGASSDTSQGHLVFADQLIHSDDYMGAIGELLRALVLQPADLVARRQLANAYEKLDDQDHAILEYYKILGAAPDDVNTRAILGKALLARGHTKEAAEQFRIALKYTPDSKAIQGLLEQAVRATPPVH